MSVNLDKPSLFTTRSSRVPHTDTVMVAMTGTELRLSAHAHWYAAEHAMHRRIPQMAQTFGTLAQELAEMGYLGDTNNPALKWAQELNRYLEDA